MEHIVKQEIMQATREYMALHNMSQAELARKTNTRPEYLSIMLKENSNFMYSAGMNKDGFINVKYFNNIASFIGYKIEKQYWQIQPTSQMNAILAHLEDAKKHHQTITMIGETGCGKSYISNVFASKNPIDTFIVTAGSSDTLGDLIDKIVDELRIHATGKSKSTKIRQIVGKMSNLRNYGNTPMLIIDEGEYLKQGALCAIKELYDGLSDVCSIVLIGTDQLMTNIEKLKRRNKSGIPQFHRRIKFGLRILPNIDRSYQIFVNDIDDRELKKFILTNCSNYGELHDLLVPALREAERLQAPLTMELVRRVLNLPDGNISW